MKNKPMENIFDQESSNFELVKFTKPILAEINQSNVSHDLRFSTGIESNSETRELQILELITSGSNEEILVLFEESEALESNQPKLLSASNSSPEEEDLTIEWVTIEWDDEWWEPVIEKNDSLTNPSNAKTSIQHRSGSLDSASNSEGHPYLFDTISGGNYFRDFVGKKDTSDYYCFNPNESSEFELSLNDLIADLYVQFNSSGRVITSSTRGGSRAEGITLTLIDKVFSFGKANTKFSFFIEENLDYYENQKLRIKSFLQIIIQEYSKLANLDELSESNGERIREILDIAKSDDLLSSLIKRIDSISEELGLFSEEKLDYYKNRKAKLKEFLSVNQTVESYQLTPKQKSLIQEYSKLANLSELSESNADRMGEIIEMAESDDLLSSWIEKIDEEISEELGLFSEEKLDYYKNRKAKLKEFLSVNQTVESYQLTPKQKSLIQEYSKLANLSELSESNAERMGEILEMAESDDLLSSWIEKIDEKISENNGLFSEENLDYYENEKARIKEFLPVNETLKSYQLTAEKKSLIQEYSKLANLPELSESNADRMGEILEMAESDDLLSFWIEKIDEEISERLGLFSEENLDYYENQKARIKEFLPVNQTLESYQLTPKQKSLIQEYLKLANLSELSESNADRMGEILEMAESDD